MIFHVIYVFLTLAVSSLRSQSGRDRRPSISIPQGSVVGTKLYGDSGKVSFAYYGIPYATPPIGPLRFQPPQKHRGWNGTLQAYQYAPRCPQLSSMDNYNEDCLYLNVWIPENAQRYGSVPVLIIFEGFEYAKSNKIPIPGQNLAMEGIVVVTVNYRLNVFGFICIGTADLRGNLGLMDQYLAMVWVKENIPHFGGDSDKVTLFGHLSGGASVVYHMISPRTSGLFQKAILSSGSVLSPWHAPTTNFHASQKVIKNLGCDSYTELLQCLRTKSTQDILKAYEEYIESGYAPESFMPVVDTFLPASDQYLPIEPSRAFKEGTYIQVPLLTGISKPVADPQFSQWMELASQGSMNLQQFMEQLKIPEILRRYQFINKEEIAELLKWRYVMPAQQDARSLLEQLKTLDFEAKIQGPEISQLKELSETYSQPIYAYFIDEVGFVLNATDSSFTTDLLLLFGPFLLNQLGRRRFTSNETKFSTHLKQLWTNFIIFGNPTPNNHKIWRTYSHNDYYVEEFNEFLNKWTNNSIEKYRKISFWTELLPKMKMLSDLNSKPKEFHYSPDPAAGFKHAMYTLVGLVIALLALLLICIVLLKKRNRQNERHLHMGY
ncbi:PREDICTED: acylcarnitine hydrolase [Nicrophorus vespilloides]|uniref:Acylcarnitine hydrolase n=1 Tax=Nicrophorus vespilloides TaxID=110193 RepID=A0ABM1MME0_NICVS|nr:PREDICTED: acylcarnitine hydrolase [Nicrophorus vespilloides]